MLGLRACDASVPVCPDAAYVGKGAATTDEARRKLVNGKHGDTWNEMFKFGQHPLIERTPAHLTAARIVSGEISVERFLTNAIADAAAGAAAITANAGDQTIDSIGATVGHVANLVKRMASIEAARWEIGDGLTDKPPPLPEFVPSAPKTAEQRFSKLQSKQATAQ